MDQARNAPVAGKPGRRGFTLVELIAVLALVVVIAFLATPNFSHMLDNFREVRCAANMRSINVALRAYLHDHGNVWPQGPAPGTGAAWENFWLGVLQPYGISAKTWQCPAISLGGDDDEPRVHYAPTLFPPTAGIADRWATHPWLIERGAGHGQGALICFPDGSVKPFDKVLAELGVR